VPFILQSAASHILGFSPTASQRDLKTDVTVKLLQQILGGKPSPIGKQQRYTLKDPGIKGPLWVSKVSFPKPEENDVRVALAKAIDDLKEGNEKYTVPELVPLEAEWTGHRAGVDAKAPRLDLSEEQQYERMMQEVTSDVTVLYFHGGAYFMMDPATHRPFVLSLAKRTGGRCLNVRYRLSPQSAFPAALLDAFVAYLSLLAPPPGSYHKAVPAKNIVVSGDSAGGNLATSLLLLLLQLRRVSPDKTPTLPFHGQDVELTLPAGLALSSPWMDMTRCMPSILSNHQYDYLPAPLTQEQSQKYPKDDVWPTNPPRGDIYCEVSMLCHPLVSPLAARNWKGSCPIWLDYGQEMLADEGMVVARRMAQQGVKVKWLQFEALPHCFSAIFEGLKATQICIDSMADFMKDVVQGKTLVTSGTHYAAKTCWEKRVDVTLLLPEVGDEEVGRRIEEAKDKRWTGEEGEAKSNPRL
jgi:acetyl esterase/lipase